MKISRTSYVVMASFAMLMLFPEPSFADLGVLSGITTEIVEFCKTRVLLLVMIAGFVLNLGFSVVSGSPKPFAIYCVIALAVFMLLPWILAIGGVAV